MLKLALTAGLPLIKVQTNDVINVKQILEHLTGKEVLEVDADSMNRIAVQSYCPEISQFFVVSPEDVNWGVVYKACIAAGRTIIVINPLETGSTEFFDAGVMKVPQQMLSDFLWEVLADGEDVQHYMEVCGGLTLKEVGEVLRLCEAEYEHLSPVGILEIRRKFIHLIKGLYQVNPKMPHYVVEDALISWMNIEGALFKANKLPKELAPRGLLFTGATGTGKTMGAKFLSHKLEIPLFRLSVGSLMAKYVGESEGNLDIALAKVDQAEPCILLIDEIEKVFQSKEDSGVTARLLAALLWWLEEHTSRVLTVMTTNDLSALPEELIRPGRIDKVFTFEGLNHGEGGHFAKDVAHYFGYVAVVPIGELEAKIGWLYAQTQGKVTQAQITQVVFDLIKYHAKHNH